MSEIYVSNKMAELFEDNLFEAGIDFKLNTEFIAKHTAAYVIINESQVLKAEKILHKLNGGFVSGEKI